MSDLDPIKYPIVNQYTLMFELAPLRYVSIAFILVFKTVIRSEVYLQNKNLKWLKHTFL